MQCTSVEIYVFQSQSMLSAAISKNCYDPITFAWCIEHGKSSKKLQVLVEFNKW